ncbi:MAG: DUF4760 domain-containing protein [Candidatus Eremiobacteraeota bacterium]|nr:DUF4760 domain-containing protein [Candidatus Eremiobacteraeota bacterium]MBV8365362.1 DUF4760 domain-containing protein [Candidatus Eremiobacteraeota bacterium]
MSLEQLSTIGTLTTVVIVAATAIAALVQLRHLRAGNQINAILSVAELLNGRAFEETLNLIGTELAPALEDPNFRAYWIALMRRETLPPVDSSYIRLRAAVVNAANTYEQLGVLVRNEIIDRTMFVEGFCAPVLGLWNRLASLTAFLREAENDPALWENFEYLAVLGEDWLAHHRTTYPKTMRHLAITNPWPIPAASASR